jgi:hypothetical protein
MCAAGSAASFEIDQLLQPPGGSPPRKKMICDGGHGPQLLLLISYFFFFFRLLGRRRCGKASVNRVTRTRPADAMRKTPRQLHAAPFRRRVHADMSSMSSVRVRGGAEKPHLSPTPRGANMFFVFLSVEIFNKKYFLSLYIVHDLTSKTPKRCF